jgi:hypothetical protein
LLGEVLFLLEFTFLLVKDGLFAGTGLSDFGFFFKPLLLVFEVFLFLLFFQVKTAFEVASLHFLLALFDLALLGFELCSGFCLVLGLFFFL